MKILIEFDSLDEAAEFISWRNERRAKKSSCDGVKTPLREVGIGLLVQTINALSNAGFVYLEDAQAQSDNDLLHIPGFGRRNLHNLREAKPN